MESALYHGWVTHRRVRPVAHTFRRRIFLCWIDLDELPGLFDGSWLAAVEAPAPLAFRRRDYFGDPATPLADAVRDEVARKTGVRPEGPIRLLAHLRSFGLCFNPVSFYYCHDAAGELDAVLADVNNTPWNERHAYVLSRRVSRPGGDGLVLDTPKEFHVSPFMGMDLRHRWRFSRPGEQLRVRISNHDEEGRLFDANLHLERRPLTGANLARALVSQPLLTARIVADIYWQALRLRLKGAPFHAHPGSLPGGQEMQHT